MAISLITFYQINFHSYGWNEEVTKFATMAIDLTQSELKFENSAARTKREQESLVESFNKITWNRRTMLCLFAKEPPKNDQRVI